MKKTITILGETYSLYLDVPVHEDKTLEGLFGYCDPVVKKIVIADVNTVPGWEHVSAEAKIIRTNVTLRHEIIHAFLHESGLWCDAFESGSWAMNEEMVDWIARQYPKMLKVFLKLGCEYDI